MKDLDLKDIPIMKLLSKNHGLSLHEIKLLMEIAFQTYRKDIIAGCGGQLGITAPDKLIPGKSVPVLVNFFTDGDIAKMHESDSKDTLIEVRRARIFRIAQQVTLAGGAITESQLAAILGVSKKTVMRDIAELRQNGNKIHLSRNRT